MGVVVVEDVVELKVGDADRVFFALEEQAVKNFMTSWLLPPDVCVVGVLKERKVNGEFRGSFLFF